MQKIQQLCRSLNKKINDNKKLQPSKKNQYITTINCTFEVTKQFVDKKKQFPVKACSKLIK